MQVLVAGFLSPVEFGLIRVMESAIGMAVLLTASGPTAIAVATAHEDPSAENYWTLMGAAMVTAVPATLFGGLYLATLNPQVTIFALVVPLTSATRVTVGFLQGSSRVRIASKVTVRTAIVGSVIIVAASFFWGVSGWLIGRLVSEGNAARSLVLCSGNRLRAIRLARDNVVRTIVDGYQVTAALALRYAMDNVALVSLGVFHPNSESLGLFGLATTLSTIVLLVPAALVILGMPRLSRQANRPASGNNLVKLQVLTLAVALAAGALVSLCYWRLAPLLFPQFAGASTVVFILCAAAPFRAVASASGAFLLVRGQRGIQIYLNLGLAAVSIPTIVIAAAMSTHIWFLAALMLAGEAISAMCFLFATWRIQREHSGSF